jgi:anti-anti-sigma factor
MQSQIEERWLEEEQIGDTTIVSFTQSELLEETTIRKIGEQLSRLVEDPYRQQIVLNLHSVKKVSTMMLGKFIALHHRVRATGGRLVLCGIDRDLWGMFRAFRLHQLFPICADEQEALQAF